MVGLGDALKVVHVGPRTKGVEDPRQLHLGHVVWQLPNEHPDHVVLGHGGLEALKGNGGVKGEVDAAGQLGVQGALGRLVGHHRGGGLEAALLKGVELLVVHLGVVVHLHVVGLVVVVLLGGSVGVLLAVVGLHLLVLLLGAGGLVHAAVGTAQALLGGGAAVVVVNEGVLAVVGVVTVAGGGTAVAAGAAGVVLLGGLNDSLGLLASGRGGRGDLVGHHCSNSRVFFRRKCTDLSIKYRNCNF
eukprot:179002_1